MSARDDNPELHRIVVERDPWNATENDPDDLGTVTSVRFVCDGDSTAPCHHWPDCECETWGDVHGDPRKGIPPQPGHEDVQQKHCWIDPWFNDAIGDSAYEWIEAWDGDGDAPSHDDLRSGPISVTFEGEYMTWEYAS